MAGGAHNPPTAIGAPGLSTQWAAAAAAVLGLLLGLLLSSSRPSDLWASPAPTVAHGSSVPISGVSSARPSAVYETRRPDPSRHPRRSGSIQARGTAQPATGTGTSPTALVGAAAVALLLGFGSRLGRRPRPAAAQWAAISTTEGPPAVAAGSVTAVLLAGGVGKRMGASIPKQYLELRGRPIATYSLTTFAAMPEVGELVVVCEDEWRPVFETAHAALPPPHRKPMTFALPGKERQDSVFSGLQAVRPDAALVAIHDTARPAVRAADILRCLQDAAACGAAVLGVPVKPTIKEVDPDTATVVRTLDRSRLWEVQTPQCIRPDLLREGFELVRRKNLAVTDDVSIIEALGRTVRVTPGAYSNLKVTTPDDLTVAERFLELGDV